MARKRASRAERTAVIERINALPWTQFFQDYVPQALLGYHVQRPDEQRSFIIDCKRSTTASHDAGSLGSVELEACFRLIEKTSAEDYKASTGGWRPANKRSEMKHEDMQYLLVKEVAKPAPGSEEGMPKSSERIDSIRDGASAAMNIIGGADDVLGFMSYMITEEEGENVVYVYEIHLEEDVRGYGLAKHLFQIVEHIGATTGMSKIMLTVFRRNENARKFYGKTGFEIDECSPRSRKLRGGTVKEADYLIMSKRISERIKDAECSNGPDRKRRAV